MNILCPECGPKVALDEDACCKFCGAQAVGPGVDQVCEQIRQLRAKLKSKADTKAYYLREMAKQRETIDYLATNLNRANLASIEALEEIEQLKEQLERKNHDTTTK